MSGAERYYAKREAGLSPVRRDGSLTSPVTDAESDAAEDHACFCFGVAPNHNVYRTHGDKGYDFLLDRVKVDAKWLGMVDGHPRYRGHLILNPGEGCADIYVVVVGSSARGFSLLGWATRSEAERHQKDFGYGLKYALHTDRLHPNFGPLDAHLLEEER